ncbi:MAG: hypothetical protein IPL08_15155 [Saprospiraceae bacterium]|nr:hypothetical protein [Saprospiraceae bacterium]
MKNQVVKKIFALVLMFFQTFLAIYGQWSYEYLSSKTIQMGATSNGPKVYFAGGIVGDFFLPQRFMYIM